MPRIDTRRVWAPLCVVLAILVIAATPQQASPDKLTPQNRDYDQKHILLDLDFDFAKKSVSGTCEITLEVLRDEFDRILLHSEDTRIFDIRIRTSGSGQAFPARSFRMSDGLLAVELGRIFPKGQELTLEIDYESVPTRGLYFFAPTKAHPEIPTQVWSQGEARNNRHWFPCYDQPDDRITSELIARVPAEMEVISNGVLDSKKTEGETATYHFKMLKSHVPYLVSVIAGEFDHQTTEWEGIPLHTYVPKERGDTVDITFGRTEKMMKFFSDYTGLKYPYSRYSQTTVW
ncbi:MAG: hypothetical protein O6952_09610 [Planctomycetota bacterium]|nr:hypothetical protein [Planctomycetota bacterium]